VLVADVLSGLDEFMEYFVRGCRQMCQSLTISEELKRHCFHEAGHAICMAIGGIGVQLITIAEDASYVDPEPGTGRVPFRLRAALAGGIAQTIFLQKEPEPRHVESDEVPITRYLAMYKEEGQDPIRVRAELAEEAEAMLKKYWEAVQILAEMLMTLPCIAGKRCMTGVQFESLVLPIVRRVKGI
jgi:hypothetical protein